VGVADIDRDLEDVAEGVDETVGVTLGRMYFLRNVPQADTKVSVPTTMGAKHVGLLASDHKIIPSAPRMA
jgi:hypothetical protein